MTRDSRHDSWFRALLRLFPSEFRGDFGRQMAEDFRDQRHEAATRSGVVGLLRVWGRTALDLIRRAPMEHLDVLRRDAVHAVRVLRRRPASTATILLSLSLGIGVNTALFSVVSGVLWRSLPFADSERLVRIFDVDPAAPDRPNDVTPGNFLDLARQTRAFQSVAAAGRESATLVEPGEPEDIPTTVVSEGFFETLRARPILGRTFTHDDFAGSIARNEQPHRGMVAFAPTVTVISQTLWQRRFGSRPDIIGQRVRLARAGEVEIIGVMGPEMESFYSGEGLPAEWWFPEAPDPTQRRAPILDAIGRLSPGVSLTTAQAELDVISTNLAAAYASNKDHAFRAVPMLDTVVKNVRRQLTFLFGAVLCVLLVTCVNVVHLFLANFSGRRVELATRVALGATRAHLVRQTLTESMLLTALGGVGGVLMALWAVPLLVDMAPAGVPRLHEIKVDWSTFEFAGAVSAGVALFCGLAASTPLAMLTPWSTLAKARSGGTWQGRRLRRALAVCEIAVALMLVVASMLMVRTMRSFAVLDLGFTPDGVVTASLPTPPGAVGRAGVDRIHQSELEVVDAVKQLPGVVAAGVGGSPLGLSMGTSGLLIPGDPRRFDMVGIGPVSAGYFEALGARLLEGRFFGPGDRADAPKVAVLSESTARRLWPSEDAVGKTVLPDGRTPTTVVGVVADMADWGLETKSGRVFLPSDQSQAFGWARMLIRTDRNPRTLAPAIKSIVRRINPEQPFPGVEPLQDEIDRATAPRRFILQLVGVFALLGLGLAAVGIYGVLAESVAERVPEIGVRMALGARAADVLSLILGQGARMIGLGLGLGLFGAVLLRQQMTTMVFGIRTLDPISYAAACAVLAAAALAACAFPACRAAKLDPVQALRSE